MNYFLKAALFVLLAGAMWYYFRSHNAVTLDVYRQSQTSLILFTENNCSECDAARQFLEKRNAAFVECNTNQEKRCKKQINSFNEKNLPRWVYHGKSGTRFSEQQWQWLLFNEFTFGDRAPIYMNHRTDGGLLLYTSTTCAPCAQARTWLTKNKIPYQECNASTDRACENDLDRYGNKATPRWVYRGRTKIGFRESDWGIMFGSLEHPSVAETGNNPSPPTDTTLSGALH
jgi:arsenate reductase-like glutaredoxin family protein